MIQFDATHDNLTGLANRRFVLDLIRKKLDNKDQFTVLFIDFDGFKSVNDNFGHETGDLALIEGYKRIQNKIKENDILARMGGDEFVVVLNDEFDKINVEVICKRIIESFQPNFSILGHSFKMGLSIGACINSNHNYSLDELINLADQSMYNVKKT
ncbi:MAG: hypothetical protein CVV01_06150, partial [Firmicutes bacterium HGW-Firmicutes-6]